MRSIGLFMLVVLTSSPAMSQESPPAAPAEGRVIGKVWHTAIDFTKSFQYLNQVREELEIPQSPVMVMAGRIPGMGAPVVRGRDGSSTPCMKGTLFLLQTRPTVDLTQSISFQLLPDGESFETFVQAQAEAMGPNARLLGDGDLREVRLDLSPAPSMNLERIAGDTRTGSSGDAKPREQRTFSIMIAADVSKDKSQDASFSPRSLPVSISTYYRHLDGIVFSSRSSVVHTIELPTRESLQVPEAGISADLFADFDFTRIPQDLKATLWAALETQASVWLQRFDDETAGDYSLRRFLSEGRLELLKAALFDLDRAQFSLSLSPDPLTPIRSNLRLLARENSSLASVLDGISRQQSQLQALREQNSPLIVAGSFSIPAVLRPVAEDFVRSVSLKLTEAAAATPGADVLIEDMMNPLFDSIASGTTDSAFCLKGTVESGLIPCGAFRMENADQFLGSLEPFLQISTADAGLIVTRQMHGEYRMISIRAENAQIPFAGKQFPVQLNLASTGSWIWMTAGGDTAVDTLAEMLRNSESAVETSGQAEPLLVRCRFANWMGSTADPLSQIPQSLLTEVEKWLGRATSPRMSISINGQKPEIRSGENDEFVAYGAKALKPESSEFELRIRTAGQELVADAAIGVSIVKFSVAQFLAGQSRMFRNIRLPNFEPATEKVK